MGAGGPALMDVQQHSEPAPAAKKEEKLPAPQQIPTAQQTSAVSDTLRAIPTRSLESAGCRRIFIELEDKPELAREYAVKYSELVDSVVSILSDHGLTKDKPQEFITAVAGVIYSNLHIVYDASLYIAESLDKNMYDCDTSAFLVFDVAQKMGFDAKLILLPGHAIAKVEDRYFETTTAYGWNYDKDAFESKYPLVYGVFDTAQSAQCMSYFIHGQDLLGQKKYEKALSAFDRAIAIDSTVSTAHMLRADALQKLGRPEEALASEQKAIDLTPSKFAGNLYKVKGDLLLELGRPQEAILAYDTALSLNPPYYFTRMQAHSNKAQALEKLGKYAEAIPELDEAIKLYSESRDYNNFEAFDLSKSAYFKKAELLEKQGKYDEALQFYDDISQEHRSYMENSELLKGALFEKLGNSSKAIDAYIEALSAGKGDSQQALERIFAILDKSSLSQKGILAIYDKIIAIGGSASLQALMKKGDLLQSQGKYDEAAASYSQILDYYHENSTKKPPEALLKYSLAIIKTGKDPNYALRLLDSAALNAGGSLEEHGFGALHSEVVEAAKQALLPLMQKLKQDKKDWNTQLNVAYLLEITGDYKKAADAYENAIELMPGWEASGYTLLSTYIRLGNAFEKLGKFGKALDAYEEGIEKIPHAGGQCNSLFLAKAALFEKQGKPKKAIQAYDDLLSTDPFDRHNHSQKIDFLKRLGMDDEALKAYDFAISSIKESEFYSGKLDFLQKLGRLDEALGFCNAALEKFDSYDIIQAPLYLKKIELLEAAGRNDEALLVFDAAIKLNGSGGLGALNDIGIKKVEFFERLNRLEDALSACDGLIKISAQYNIVLKKGDILVKLGRAKEAIPLYDKLIKNSPEKPDAYLHKAQALETQGKYAQADEYFKNAKYLQEQK